MKTFTEILNEAKGKKPFIGTADKINYAIQLKNSIPNNEFPKRGFGGVIDNRKIIEEFLKTAKKTHVGAKGKGTLPSVKNWVKTVKPSEFYAKWKPDSAINKNDSIEMYYKD